VSDDEHALVRRWAQAVNARDRDALVAESDPEIFIYPLQVGLSGHYRGHDGARHWLDDMDASDLGHQVRYEGIRTLADGRIALFGTLLLENNPISPYTLIATVSGDKIAQMRSYLSDEETLRHLKMID
jgi:ketosteroid isomerase-like protein